MDHVNIPDNPKVRVLSLMCLQKRRLLRFGACAWPVHPTKEPISYSHLRQFVIVGNRRVWRQPGHAKSDAKMLESLIRKFHIRIF